MSRTEIDELAAAVRAGDRRALARAITLVESTRKDHREQAEALLSALPQSSGAVSRIGISGAPGVGKSTFIESFGRHLTKQEHKVAVLAVDPSSNLGGGSILGDKTRMERLSRDPNAFIRPSPSSGTLGGVARRTREAIHLVEAAGFGVVLVETVGVGQSEVAVDDLVDFFVLLVSPGGGDELQGIKRGIVELADLVVVTKSDGTLAKAATIAAADYHAALQLMRPKHSEWRAKVQQVSALEDRGLEEVWEAALAFRQALERHDHWQFRRSAQAVAALKSELQAGILEWFLAHSGAAKALAEMEEAVRRGMAPSLAARRLLARLDGGRL